VGDRVVVATSVVEVGSIPPSRSRARLVLVAARPRQWTKNLLVVAAPGAAGILAEPVVLLRVAVAFVALTLCSSATYLVNDVADAPWDARHPEKRVRPVASGALSVPAALTAAAALGAGGLALSSVLGGAFITTTIAYLAITLAYTFALKRVAVVELGVIAGGFVLRAVAGGAAANVTPSAWFLILVSCAAVLMVTGKRVADARALAQTSRNDGSRNAAYPLEYLHGLWVLAAGGAITAYCLWAFAVPHVVDGLSWSQISIVPFTLGILTYALVVQEGGGAEPENVVLHDRLLQAIGFAWVVTYAIGVYTR
jgi:decaprenyl-phosphate phosphoribosyltransferase